MQFSLQTALCEKRIGKRSLNVAEQLVLGQFRFSDLVSWKVHTFCFRLLTKQIKLPCKQAPDPCLCFVSPNYLSNSIGKCCVLAYCPSTRSGLLQRSAFCLQKKMEGKELPPSYSMFVYLKISLLNKIEPRTQIYSLLLEFSNH